MQRFGVSDQDLENMEERMTSFLQEAGQNGAMMPVGDDDEEFVPGGSPVFPFGPGAQGQNTDEKSAAKTAARDKKNDRKFLNSYCENLTRRPGTAASTTSWAATGKFTAPSRSSAAGRRTTPA